MANRDMGSNSYRNIDKQQTEYQRLSRNIIINYSTLQEAKAVKSKGKQNTNFWLQSKDQTQ